MEQQPGATFIGVPNPASDADDIDEWIIDRSPPISHVREDLVSLWREYGIVTQPAFVFVGADGSIEKHLNSGGRTGLLWRIQDLIDPAIRANT